MQEMEYYSICRPNLIGPMMKDTVYKITKKTSNSSTISDRISNMISDFYELYIKENKIVVFIFLLVIAFLVYRYNEKKKKDKEKEKETFSTQDYNMLKDVIPMQTSHLRYDTQPSFNPILGVEQQKEPIFYPPDPLPINIPNQGIKYTRNLYDDPQSFSQMNVANYDYNNVYNYPSRSYYSGTYNTYNNAQDTDIINPLGYPVNFNSSTGDYVRGMTTVNQKNIVDYQTILDGMNQNLTDALKIGPKYLNMNNSEPTMEPPYADDL